jgi:hypothetical protein
MGDGFMCVGEFLSAWRLVKISSRHAVQNYRLPVSLMVAAEPLMINAGVLIG